MDNRRRKTAAELLYGRHRQTEYIALLLCLAVLVTAGIGAVFHITAIAKTYQTVLTCTAEPESGQGYADFFVHTHSEDCRDEFGNLVCELPEIEEHIHGEGCYTTTTELVCTTPESDGHHHTDACYTEVRGELICGQEESEGVHTHTDACYAVEKKLSCGMEEGEGAHHHTDSCYRTVTTLTCEEPEIILHTHTDNCFREDGDGNRILICEQLEVREHVHGPECFTVYELDDGEPEEEATEEAVPEVETTEETTTDEPSVTETAPQDETTLPDETALPTAETDPGEAPAPETEAENIDTETKPGEEPVPGEETTPDENTESGEETPDTAETTETAEETAGDSTPEQRPVSFTRQIGGEYKGATVLVEVPEGGLDESAGLNLENTDEAAVRAAILALVNANAAEGEEREITSLFAIDIGFASGGVPAEPSGDAPLRITLRAKEIRSMTAPKLFHVKDGSAERVTDAVFDTEAGAVTFTARDFSPFAVAELTGEDPETEKETPEETAEETVGVSMPEQIFDGATDDIEVHVTAPEGAFPAGTTMTVTAVTDDETLSALAGAVDGKVMNVQAVDIVFKNAAGEQIEPRIPIQVNMKAAIINEGDDVALVHLPEAQNTEAEAEAETEETEETPSPAPAATAAPAAQIVEVERIPSETNPETMEDEIRFESDAFSIYGLVSVSIEKNILASNGQNYKITVTWNDDAGIPENADLKVTEILPAEGETDETSAYEEYLAKTAEALGWESAAAQYARFFDITIVGEDGEKVQPAEGSTVNVTIELADKDSSDAAAANTQVVHFADGNETAEVLENTVEAETQGVSVSFEAASFSVYAVVEAPGAFFDLEDENGFYLSYTDASNITRYWTNTVNNKSCFTEATNILAAAVWFFEKAGEETEQYYLYTVVNGNKKYLQQTSSGNNNVKLDDSGTPLKVSAATKEDTYLFKHADESKWLQHSNSGGGIRFYTDANNAINASFTLTSARDLQPVVMPDDCYSLDGKTYGIVYNNDSAAAAALTAEAKDAKHLVAEDLLIRPDVLSNSGVLFVSADSDITEWTFHNEQKNQYKISVETDQGTRYLAINASNEIALVEESEASVFIVSSGTGNNAGKYQFSVGDYKIGVDLNGQSTDKGFWSTKDESWLSLVTKSTLSDGDFVNYSARKISASDEILSATEKDEDGNILTDEDGKPVKKSEKAKVIIYTRVWNEDTKKYEYYAIDHDGSLVRVYDSGDLINWVGNQVNSALWEFTEYTNDDGTPSWYYELENTAYPNTFLAPQSGSIISDQAVGLNMEGRQEGFDYTNILAWDEAAYAYSGLKVITDENGGKRVVACPMDEAGDFHFAVMMPAKQEADQLTTVATVDNNEHGISIKMIDFNNTIVGQRDTVQHAFFGSHTGTNHDPGLLSTDLVNGYPSTTSATGNAAGHSLSELFKDMTSVNHLFLQSVYNESGYLEYDSTQNFAHLNVDGTFTVYDQLGAVYGDTGKTREHGQFMPYNDISQDIGYSYDNKGNLLTNQYNVLGQELPDTDPRKGEPLYAIPANEADFFFGMELSASFTQTASGLDNWGHDIIFEFTGDDDFWLYVDNELVLDLGGVHSALGGSVNFRTGDVTNNNTKTTLYDIFRENYVSRGMSSDQINQKLGEIFEEKVVDGKTVHVFKDYSTHTMKMFYMERGAGASNLKMRFNLASVQPGKVELSKKLDGAQSASNKLIQYPYQIWYATANYKQNEDGSYVFDEQGNRIIEGYNDPVLLTQPTSNQNLTGQVYAVYKDTKTLIPYRQSMTIDGQVYDHVFLLKAGETAVINFPENTYQYKIVECGVNTEVYDQVFVNGEEVVGKPYHNTDGEATTGQTGETGETGTPQTETETYQGSVRSDFGIPYNTTTARPRVEYTNQAAPDVMRTLEFKKVLYDTEGHLMNDAAAANVSSTFNFRLYLGNEFADENNLSLADKYSYYVKDPQGYYGRWDSATQTFTRLEGIDTFEEFLNLPEDVQRSATYTTSINGAISKIRAGYTVEVRDLIVGSKYKVEERDGEIPRGYTRRDSDGYVRTDLGPDGVDYVYYTENGTYGRHVLTDSSTTTAEAISDTIASKTDSPKIEIRNQEGWGLTAQKVWTDKDFMIHDPIYLAVYLKNADDTPDSLVEGTVRRLNSNETEIYWFFQDLKVNNATEPYRFDQFVVREVTLTGTPSVDETTGVVTGYNDITPIADGANISVSGRTISGTSRTETYTVGYQPGDSTGQNANIRTDTVTNSRPGIQIYKTNWEGDNLSGAVFTLKDASGNDVGAATYTSNRDGLVTTAYLSEGTFTLNEIRTPTGYVAMDEPITLAVTTTEPSAYDLTVTVGATTYYVKVSGPTDFYTTNTAIDKDMPRITVKNRTVQELKVFKMGVDGSTRTPLSEVHFALYEQVKDNNGHLVPAYIPKSGYDDLVTDKNGLLNEITMSLGAGTYYLREKEAPSGYKKLANDLCFTIGEDGTVKINTAGYTNWLKRTVNNDGAVFYQIEVENTPLGITLRKTDEKGTQLPGSKFTLCKKNDSGSFEAVSEYELGEGGLVDLTTDTEKTFTGLPSGIYKLTETHAPSGYVIITKNIYFKVSDGAVTLTDEGGEAKEYSEVSLADDNTTIIVRNTPGVELPSTGGIGTRLFTAIGAMLTMTAGAVLMIRRKRACTS